MYSRTSRLSISNLLLEQPTVLGVSMMLAEMFYKLHSFTLGCLFFLATWFTADACAMALRKA